MVRQTRQTPVVQNPTHNGTNETDVDCQAAGPPPQDTLSSDSVRLFMSRNDKSGMSSPRSERTQTNLMSKKTNVLMNLKIELTILNNKVDRITSL